MNHQIFIHYSDIMVCNPEGAENMNEQNKIPEKESTIPNLSTAQIKEALEKQRQLAKMADMRTSIAFDRNIRVDS
ncbi:hypothetical protein [Paenibacillus mucilaginosus]|uniref:hypothetical protein n=1 Tax=Paenibacillus mucilaginosus TaxID=61624 RepID=UPI003D24C49A